MPGRPHTVAESTVRFWSRVNKNGPVRPTIKTACWLWTGCRQPWGHGCGSFAGAKMLAHRISWMIHRGPIPDGLFVLHHCDNPPCVNPEHLFLGTQRDNLADMDRKGRRRVGVGERQGHAKLTEGNVREIRRRYAAGEDTITLACEFGITRCAVYPVLSRRTWKHVK